MLQKSMCQKPRKIDFVIQLCYTNEPSGIKSIAQPLIFVPAS